MEHFLGFVLFLLICYYGFYKKLILPAIERKKAQRLSEKRPGQNDAK